MHVANGIILGDAQVETLMVLSRNRRKLLTPTQMGKKVYRDKRVNTKISALMGPKLRRLLEEGFVRRRKNDALYAITKRGIRHLLALGRGVNV